MMGNNTKREKRYHHFPIVITPKMFHDQHKIKFLIIKYDAPVSISRIYLLVYFVQETEFNTKMLQV